MELTQGNLASLYRALRGAFLTAVEEAPVPELMKLLLLEAPSSVSEEEIPVAAFLGDLEELLDQYGEVNIGMWLQRVANRYFGRILRIPRAHIEEDTLGIYTVLMERFGRIAATHAYRRVPNLFTQGFITAWVDGANVWSNNHVWVGGRTFDNLDSQPLTNAGFELVTQHLMDRTGPDGQSLELDPTHLIVGPANWVRGRQILNRELVSGGDTNIHYEEVELVKWSQLRGAHAHDWFVGDLSPDKPQPCVLLNRLAAALEAQDRPTDDGPFLSEVFRYKAFRRYGMAVMLPWRFQAVRGGETPPTTTTGA